MECVCAHITGHVEHYLLTNVKLTESVRFVVLLHFVLLMMRGLFRWKFSGGRKPGYLSLLDKDHPVKKGERQKMVIVFSMFVLERNSCGSNDNNERCKYTYPTLHIRSTQCLFGVEVEGGQNSNVTVIKL